jgi:hypothetical protein
MTTKVEFMRRSAPVVVAIGEIITTISDNHHDDGRPNVA